MRASNNENKPQPIRQLSHEYPASELRNDIDLVEVGEQQRHVLI
ncbi:MAG: hypothetical protein VB957_14165 [Pseudomonadales bacterium]|jgi:hypothetical protein